MGKIIAGRRGLALVFLVLIASLSLRSLLSERGQENYVPDPARTSEVTSHGPQADSVTFAVIGDYGFDGAPEGRVAALVSILRPDLVITAGDNNYQSGKAESIDQNTGKYYATYIYPYKGQYGKGSPDINRFFPSIGNHDWPPEPYLDYFDLPGNGRYYDFTWGPVHFFVIDTCKGEPDGIGKDSAQAMWLKRKLAASESPFKFVYGHHPPYSSGTHGSFKKIRWPFKKWGADALFFGHDHTYERLLVDGIPYFVVGLGGRSIYPFGDILKDSAFRYNADYGAMLVKVGKGRAIFSFYNVNGDKVDEFKIKKK